jgi:predicted nucleic acid-binding protein
VRTSADAIYLDSSALVKLVIDEQESIDLAEYLAGGAARFSSALARVEVVRALRAQGSEVVTYARAVIRGIDLIAVDDAVLDRAAELDPRVLRSLDAIHLASALSLEGRLRTIVTYDERMLRAAEALALPIASPGRARR